MISWVKLKIGLLSLVLSLSTIAAINTQQSVLNMKVTSDGIYRVTYADIIAQGVDLTGTSLSNIAITLNGTNIPIKIVGDNSFSFGVNSYIEFVGKTAESLYQHGNVYNLVLSHNVSISNANLLPQLNKVPESFYMHTDHYADNTDYSFGSPISDPWYARRLIATATSPATTVLNFDINNLSLNGNVVLEMNIWGGTDYPETPDHHVIYEINGQTLDDFQFDGIKSEVRNYVLPSTDFSMGSQVINVRVPPASNTDADVVHVESWKVTYPRSFVLTNKQIDFDVNVSNLNYSDSIFAHSFEDLVRIKNAVNRTQTFSIKNANNENYRVYGVDKSGAVKSIITTLSSNCTTTTANICTLNFSIENLVGRVYVAAESQLKTPILTLPVVLTDIKQGFADYLIISHPDFIGTDLDAFVADKQLNFNVKVVDVEQIYAQYGYGNISANSISKYIGFAVQNLGVKNVLLVGGDTYDYKNYLSSASISFIPTRYGRTDDIISYAPIDAKYVDIDNDNIPDVNIGRFPVRTVLELQNLLKKITDYNNKTYANTVVFAADKYDANNGYSFKQDADLLIGALPVEWQNAMTINNRAYLDDDGVTLAKSKINSNINQGVALTSFIGHSSFTAWSQSRMFRASDANLLTNANSPTLVTQWGCYNTYFVSPTQDTLAHAFLLNPNGGAASVLGASTLTVAEHEKELALLVLKFLTQDGKTLGDAVTQAKQIYAQTNPDALDVILGWNILGDPSLKL